MPLAQKSAHRPGAILARRPSIRRGLATATAALAAAAVAPAAFAAPATASGATAAAGSAFGIMAQGALVIPAVPSVSSSTSRTERATVAGRNAAPLADVQDMAVEASSKYARARLSEVDLLNSAFTARTLAAQCGNGRGTVRLTDATLAGRDLPSAPLPNTTVPITLDRYGTVPVTLNKQVWQPDGRLAVTGASIALPAAGGTPQTVDIGSATCGRVRGPEAAGGATGDVPQGDATGGVPQGDATRGDAGAGDPVGSEAVRGPESPETGASGPVPEAPAPVPVHADLPVTG